MDSIRKRLTFANVTSVAALFIALGAGAFAAGSHAPKNSVTSRSIKNGAIKSKDVRNDGLTGTNIDEATLACSRIASCGSGGPRGATGPSGVTGPTGPAGSARAYGVVLPGGHILRSKGVAVSDAAGNTGVYCIQLDPTIDASNAVVLASVDRLNYTTVGGAAGTNAFVTPLSSKTIADCGTATGNQIEIRTYARDGADNVTVTNEGFFFMVP
jgi:hypothetical protein